MTEPAALTVEPVLDALVARVERLQTGNAATMRRALYDELERHGVNVGALVTASRDALKKEIESRIKNSNRLAAMLRRQLDAGKIKADRIAAVQNRLANQPKTIEAHQRALRAITSRPPVFPTAPTPERHKQAPAGIHAEVAQEGTNLRRHHAAWPIDALSAELLTAAEYNAAVRLRDAYWLSRPPSNTTNLNGAGGGFNGGLLPTERRAEAGRDLKRFWARLDQTARYVLLNFVLELSPPGCSRPLTATEFGQAFGQVKAVQRARGVTDGAIKACLGQLAALAREFDVADASARRRAQQAKEAGRPVWGKDRISGPVVIGER